MTQSVERSSEIPHTTAEVAGNYLQGNPSARLVGSLARAAIMGLTLPEYRDDGSRRDIDIIRHDINRPPVSKEDGVELDSSFEEWVKHTANGVWLRYPKNPAISVEVPHAEEVFSPHQVNYDGIPITTYHPEVLQKVNDLKGVRRPKDKSSLAVYDDYMQEFRVGSVIHPDLLGPFDTFREALLRRPGYRIAAEARNIYHRVAPASLRKRLQIRDRLGR